MLKNVLTETLKRATITSKSFIASLYFPTRIYNIPSWNFAGLKNYNITKLYNYYTLLRVGVLLQEP